MKCLLPACILLIAVIVVEGRRYGEKRLPIHPKKPLIGHPKKTFGSKGVIGNKKKVGFFDGFRKKGIFGGSKKGLNKGTIKDKGIIPGKTGLIPDTKIIPDKTGIIGTCPSRPCLQTQEFIPQECRRPQFFLHNGRQCPDCDIDICIGGSILPDNGGVFGGGLGPRAPLGPRRNLPGDLDWQRGIGTDFPVIPGGVSTPVNGAFLPDPRFGGQIGPDQFGPGSFDQFGLQNDRQFGPLPNSGLNGLNDRFNAGFSDFDPSWNTGNVGDFGASWRDNAIPTNRRSSFI
ncbi:uncharacterized protein LOC133181318 [Saccostrea echinata]|uniref:uncharacterized protein LOC133181318 n=1 Tax=Saccostrea echinata TaxID=191078 RepID=UPI002A83EC5A|nr:uncharacterized protein LOC133181318 [Saccostrea echinata]